MNLNEQFSILPAQTTNGRVDIKTQDVKKQFQLYDKIPANQCVTFRQATEGLWNETMLSAAFFSRANIQILQNGIRAGIYRMSNGQYVIGEQDCDSLKIIMRSIFLQYATNLPSGIPEQIAQLNQRVLDYCTQQVFSEAQGYMKYIDDASTLVVPIAHPVQASNTDRTLELKAWF